MSALPQGRTEQDDTREVIAEREAAIRNHDARRLVQVYTADTVIYDLAPPLRLKGSDALDPNALEDRFATWTGTIGLEHRDLDVTAAGDLAFAHGLLHLTGSRTSGEETAVWVRQTFGLRRVNGAWRIVHEHASVPFYMDGSDRAAVDLKP
jgi:ketosteroid isomerase-like protein